MHANEGAALQRQGLARPRRRIAHYHPLDDRQRRQVARLEFTAAEKALLRTRGKRNRLNLWARRKRSAPSA